MPIQHLVSGRAAAKKARLLQHISAASEPASTLRLASNNGPGARHLPAGGESIAPDSYDSSCDGSSVLSCQSIPGLWAAAIPSVVLVSVSGCGWASGIVMNRDGFILTNGHVVQPSVSISPHSHDNDSHHPAFCKLRLRGSADWHVADIVYMFKHVLDLAVLRIRDVHDGLRLQPAVLQRHAVSAGQPVAVVGHALFSPDRNMQPSITVGNVSKVLPLVGETMYSAAQHLPLQGSCWCIHFPGQVFAVASAQEQFDGFVLLNVVVVCSLESI